MLKIYIIIIMKRHKNSLAGIESDWTSRDGVDSIISNFSCTKQIELIVALEEENLFVNVFRDNTVFAITLCLTIEDDGIFCSTARWCTCTCSSRVTPETIAKLHADALHCQSEEFVNFTCNSVINVL